VAGLRASDRTSILPGSAMEPRTEQHDQPQNQRRLRTIVEVLRSLQCKSTVLVVALTLSVTVLVSGYLLRSSVRWAREQHDQEMIRLSSLIAQAASQSLAAGDIEGLAQLGEEIADGSPMLYTAFTGTDGRLLASASSEGFGGMPLLLQPQDSPLPPGTPVHHPATRTTPAFLDITYPIKIDNPRQQSGGEAPSTQLIGYVRAGMSVQGWQRAMSNALDLVTGVGTIFIVVAIPLGFLLVRRIVTPLSEVSQAMQQFSEGKLHVRSRVRRRDEIGQVAGAFNLMADQHQQTHNRIVKLNAELEERVARRTRQLRELASREPLTGLYNRRHFGEVLRRRYSEAIRYDTGLSCMMIDVDDFKQVNDQCGHHVGDNVLVLAATTIAGQLRTADLAARYGGDEFVVLLPQTEADRARVLGERICEEFINEATNRFPQTRVSMSIGIASLGSLSEKAPEALIRAADGALYEAKAAGKSCIMTATPAPEPTAN